ncbi:hypothetical protein ACJJID_16500 [Microbulbifer sp. CnH-101-G]|uniref:hypothetical protein n=1 Tax=Microbulbifer sp. CnH-101-G TaxID=3243393 RepID=UPI004039F1E4
MNRAVKAAFIAVTVCTALTLGACATDSYYNGGYYGGYYRGGGVAYTSSFVYPYATPNYYPSSNIYVSYRTPVYQYYRVTPRYGYYYGGYGGAYSYYRAPGFRGNARYRARYYYRGLPYYNRFNSPGAAQIRYRAQHRGYRGGHRGYRSHRGYHRIRGGHHHRRR